MTKFSNNGCKKVSNLYNFDFFRNLIANLINNQQILINHLSVLKKLSKISKITKKITKYQKETK